MRLQHYTGPEAFSALHSDWNALVQESYANTVFSTWEWQTTWWQHFAAGQLWLTTLTDDGGRLRAIFPCSHRTTDAGERRIQLIGCTDVADYLDLIMAREAEGPLLEAFLDLLASQAAPAWDVVELCNVRDGSPTRLQLPEMARARGLQVEVTEETVCPLIELPATWDDYLASIDKKQRHEIRRKLRRAEDAPGMEWYVVEGQADLPAEVDAFLALVQRSAAEKEAFMDDNMRAFFHDLARAMQGAGWLELMQLKLGGKPAASIMSFDYENSLMLYNSGFDPETGPGLSPGIVLVALCIRHSIELKRDVFDFLRGDEEYKYRFGARDTQLYRVLIKHGA